MALTLPEPIAVYVAANAQLDVDAMLKPFAADAVLIDNGNVTPATPSCEPCSRTR